MLWAVTYGALVNILSRQPSARTFLSSRSPSEDDFAESPTIQIWDHVFKDSVLKQVKQAGDARSHGFTSVIDRQDTAATRTPLETAILVILDQLEAQDNGATTSSTFHAASSQPILQKQRFVEYWWREKVRMLEAHRDIDEEYNKRHQIPTALGSSEKVGLQRCPTFGHVLYVDMIGDFLAPTLVWKEQGTPKLDFDSGVFLGGPPKTLESLSVVPSVTNRLLRFRGDCLHAVAYPIEDLLGPPVSILEEEGLPKRRLPKDEDPHGESRRTPRRWHDTTDQVRRKVLLFNTWEVAPIYPPVETNTNRSNSEPSLLVCKRFEEWKFATPQFPKYPSSQHHTTSSSISPTSRSDTPWASLSVPLLGGPSRRCCSEEFLASLVDRSAAYQALSSRRDVHCLPIVSDKALQ